MGKLDSVSIGIWITIFLISIVVAVISPVLQQTELTDRILGAILATISFALLFKLIVRIHLRYKLKQILGHWLYITFPHNKEERLAKRGYGLMKLYLNSSNELKYRVQLFRDLTTLLTAARDDFSPKGAHGRAWNKAINYDNREDHLWLIYEATYNSPKIDNRIGYLFVDFTSSFRPNGRWASDPKRAELSGGEMHLARLEQFEEVHESIMKEKIETQDEHT